MGIESEPTGPMEVLQRPAVGMSGMDMSYRGVRCSWFERKTPNSSSHSLDDLIPRSFAPFGVSSRGGEKLVRKGDGHDTLLSSSTYFPFGKDAPTAKTPFSFPANPQRLPIRGIKRRRHAQDVDGPNTSDLYCKKRRLRAELITSRLSQPFSQPATHILNREGQESGDKRFLKMATRATGDAIAARKRKVAELNGTSVLRFSVMNRIRKRLGIGKPVLTKSSGLAQAPVAKGGLSNLETAASRAQARMQAPQNTRPMTRLSDSSGASCPASPMQSPTDRIPTSPLRSHLRVSKPAALPLPSADISASNHRTAPRIETIRSPELQPNYNDDLEEDSFGFLHVDYEDEDEATASGGDAPLSDFGSIIFGAGGGAPKSPELGPDDGSYEEYLDELDGLSWLTR